MFFKSSRIFLDVQYLKPMKVLKIGPQSPRNCQTQQCCQNVQVRGGQNETDTTRLALDISWCRVYTCNKRGARSAWRAYPTSVGASVHGYHQRRFGAIMLPACMKFKRSERNEQRCVVPVCLLFKSFIFPDFLVVGQRERLLLCCAADLPHRLLLPRTD